MSDANTPVIDDLTGDESNTTPVDRVDAIDLDIGEELVIPTEAEVMEEAIYQNVHVEEPWTINDKKIDEKKPFIDLPSDTTDNTVSAISRAPNISHTSSDPDRKWAEVLNNGTNHNMDEEPLLKALYRKDANYGQTLSVNGKKYTTAITPLKAPADSILSGKRAVIRASYYGGLGGVSMTPLWHSGFWINFKPPMETDFVDLNRLLLQDKVSLGRQTVGAIYSNMTSFMVDRVIDFAIDHIYSMSVELEPGMTRADIKKLILPQDIGYIVTGLMSARYTKGYQYRRACTHSPDKCHHVIEDIIDLTKISYVDRNALTEWQKTHMTRAKANSVKIADVNRYRDEMVSLRDKVVSIGFAEMEDRVAQVTLHVPNITEYVEAGYRWIDSIVETVNRGMTENVSNRDKERFINQHARATKLRTYAHWVKQVEFNGIIINDRETIEDMLNVYSADDVFRTDFIKAVKEYICDTTIGLIGIPTYECPSCKQGQAVDTNIPATLKNIVPIDALNLFFTLNIQLLERISQREQ